MLHNLAQLPRYRALIQSLVARELKARYRGSVLGFFWSFINPLTLLLIYTFVFKYIMPSAIKGIDNYSLFMFCGLLPWTWFASSLTEASGVADLGRQPDQEGAVPGGDPADRHRDGEHDPLLPGAADPGRVPDLLQGAADARRSCSVFRSSCWCSSSSRSRCALILSALTVHFRDIKDILSNVLSLWFFATPIIYSYLTMPESAQGFKKYLNLNPFTHIVISYQEILFFAGPFGHWKWLAALGVGVRRVLPVCLLDVRPPARFVRGGSVDGRRLGIDVRRAEGAPQPRS